MGQIIRVYDTEANAIAGGATGMISSATVDSNAGAIHNSSDTIPYYIYNRYYYRIDANEPVIEFHIDWDDGVDNSPEKRNLQIVKLDKPSFFCVVEHIYTEACTEAKKFFPMVRVKSMDGFLSKFYTNDAAENIAHTSTKALETFSASIGAGQNETSVLSFEKAGADLIPHFCPSNVPPVAVLKTDRKRIFSGIHNRAIDKMGFSGTTYPLLYAYTDGSTTSVSVKLTVQGYDDRAVREYTLTEIVDADGDIDTSGEIDKFCVPFASEDRIQTLLRAELLKGNALADNERVYIKVFDAKNDFTQNIDVSDDDTVCILSNGNPIVDLNEPNYSVQMDSSESFTKASNLSIQNVYLDDDTLRHSTIQSQTSNSSNIGLNTDEIHANFKITSESDIYNNTQLSYTNDNLGHIQDSDGRFYDFHRLLRLQVRDNYTLPTDMLDKANQKSFIEHYDDDQYVSTVNSGILRIPTNLQSRGLLLYSNDNDVEQAFWQDLTALSRTNGTMIGGSGDLVLRHGADTTQSTTHTRTPHPKNHLLLCKTDLFDRVHLRTDNIYTPGETPTEIQITASYAHKDGWKPLEIEDGTLGLKTSGGIKFKVPADWKQMSYTGIESGTWTGPVPADSSETAAEVTRITFTSDDKSRYNGKFVNIFMKTSADTEQSDATETSIVFWFDGTGSTSQPTVSGAEVYVEVDISSGSTRDDYAASLRQLVDAQSSLTASSVDTSGSNAFFDVTQDLTGDVSNVTTDTGDITLSVSTAGAGNTADPKAMWDFDAYAILISFNVKAAATKNIVKAVWPYSNKHSQLIKIVDPHHVNLNDIAIAQSISFTRKGKYTNMEDRFGRTEIRKLGAAGGTVTFGSVDLGDTDAKGNRKKIKRYQQNATPVFLDVEHKSGEKTRFYGVITSMSEDHPVGLQFPKYAVRMQVSHILEMSSDGTLLSDKISIGGNINDTRQFVSKT
tara:strand:- start:575 stop:3436 length:2862 start_codon:yes stop_codon:yes gene_type:complete